MCFLKKFFAMFKKKQAKKEEQKTECWYNDFPQKEKAILGEPIEGPCSPNSVYIPESNRHETPM